MSSEEEIQLDLSKPPPHLEGELLKQNSTRTPLLRGWRKYYFAIVGDKLQYYRKKEDYPSKEPIAFVRMSQIEDITQAVFSEVPKGHDLNCGFRIVAFRPVAGEKEVINLLAETPDEMKEWVHRLHYIKQYWSKMEVRETLISEEQERRLIEKILRDEEETYKEVLPNESGVTEEQSEPEASQGSVTLMIYFDDGSKTPVKIIPSDTTADLLDKVKDKVTSSAALLWVVDREGHELVLNISDHPVLFQNKAHKFYALSPSKRVLVVFCNSTVFETLCVPVTITSLEVLEHHEIATLLDINGIVNRGLFLKTSKAEHMFDSNECPCEALFSIDDFGSVVRISEGHLLVKNKAATGSQTTRFRRPSMRSTFRSVSNNTSAQEERFEEEEIIQAKALDIALQKRGKPTSTSVSMSMDNSLAGTENVDQDSRDLEEAVVISAPLNKPSSARSVVMTPTVRARSLKSGPVGNKTDTLTVAPKPRSPSPKRAAFTEDPATKRLIGGGASAGLRRQGATRVSGRSPTKMRSPSSPDISDKPTTTETIKTPVRPSDQGQVNTTPTTNASSINKTVNPNLSTPSTTEATVSQKMVQKNQEVSRSESKPQPPEDRATFEQSEVGKLGEKKEPSPSAIPDSPTLSATTTPVSITPTTSDPPPQAEPSRPPPQAEPSRPPPQAEPFRPLPMVINLDKLAALNKAPPTSGVPGDSTTSSSVVGRQLVPIDVRTPNMLKIVLLQASGPSSAVSEAGPMDLIALSGVCLRNERGTWRIVPGSNFHEPPPTTSTDHTETFPLTGGIRAVFNHTQKCWYVLPPLTVTTGEPQQETKGLTDSQKSDSVKRSNSHSQPTELFLSKKVLVTGVGGAIHSVLAQFEQTRNAEEKKRIGCDMTNPNMGHLVRGALCTALAGVLLDGLKPYRFQGLVTDDIWKVTSSFWQEAVSKGHLLPTIDKQVFQPIRLVDGSHDNNMKYRTFICSALNKGALSTWIETLPNQRDTLNRHYQPTSFLVLASENGGFQGLFSELLVTLEPLVHVPFSFSIDFELRQAEVARFQPPVAARSTSKEEPLQRSNVILKTNASTGQTTGNIVNAVWERPQEQTNSSEDSPIIQEDVDSSRSAAVDVSKTVADRPNVQGHYQKQKTVSNLFGSLSVTTSGWIKKMSTSLQQFDINAGGAMIPKSTPPSLKTSPSELAPPPPERRVEAIFSNTAEEHDELSFQKGDVLTLKEQINTEWYLCTKGDQTGIVPANYVRVLEKSP